MPNLVRCGLTQVKGDADGCGHARAMKRSHPPVHQIELRVTELSERRNLRLLMIEGRMSLFIGTAFLALCLVGADLLSGYTSNTVVRLFKEGLLIGGWVAMWRPLQILLYEWWPILRKRTIYLNLGRAIVVVVPAKA